METLLLNNAFQLLHFHLLAPFSFHKKISRALSNGKTKNIEQEEAFLLPEITQQTYDLMTANLNIDPEYIVDRIAWHLDMPFGDSIGVIVKEYKAARNLHPVRVIVMGPPASGKTRVASYLAKHYDIHYVHVKSLIADTVQALVSILPHKTFLTGAFKKQACYSLLR